MSDKGSIKKVHQQMQVRFNRQWSIEGETSCYAKLPRSLVNPLLAYGQS